MRSKKQISPKPSPAPIPPKPPDPVDNKFSPLQDEKDEENDVIQEPEIMKEADEVQETSNSTVTDKQVEKPENELINLMKQHIEMSRLEFLKLEHKMELQVQESKAQIEELKTEIRSKSKSSSKVPTPRISPPGSPLPNPVAHDNDFSVLKQKFNDCSPLAAMNLEEEELDNEVIRRFQPTTLAQLRKKEEDEMIAEVMKRIQAPTPALLEKRMREDDDEVGRRDSVLGAIYRSNAAQPSSNRIFMASDKHSKIVWERKTVDGFLSFLEEIMKYQQTEEIHFPAPMGHIHKGIAESIKTKLRELFPLTYGKDMLSVYKAKLPDIIRAAQVILAPTDVTHFNVLLTTSCNAYKVQQVGNGYATTKENLDILRDKFRERFDFLCDGVKWAHGKAAVSTIIPSVDFKPGGLLNAWMQLTPDDSRDQFMEILGHQKYQDLDSFLTAFFAVVDETYGLNKAVIRYMLRIKKKNGNKRDKGIEFYSQGKPRHFYEPDRLLAQEHLDYDLYSGDIMEDYYDNYVDDAGDQVNANDDEYFDSGADLYAVAEIKNRQQFSGKSSSFNLKDRVCRQYLFEGKCVKPNCLYGHSWQKMMEERSTWIKKWQEDAKESDLKTKNLSRTRPLPAVPRPAKKPGLCAIDDMSEGISPGDDDGEVDGFNLMQTLFAVADIPDDAELYNATHRPGQLTKPDGSVCDAEVTVLFDSGASRKNYISQNMVTKLDLLPYVKKTRARCRVANGKIVDIDGMVNLTLTLSTGESKIAAFLEFLIMENLSEDIVLGLKDIMVHYRDVFVSMLYSVNFIAAVDKLDEDSLLQPWSGTLERAPEEIEVEDSLGNHFCFLESTPEEAVEKFLEVLPTKISEEFSNAVPVLTFLRGEGASVFNPQEWEGIYMDPIKLEFSGDLPESVKPYRSKIPIAQMESFQKELVRMLKYMYRDSHSPIASPVICTGKATPPFIRIVVDYRKINTFCRVPQYQIPDVIRALHKMILYDVFIDLDVTNAFHQVPISTETSRILSVQTPFGHFEPKFLPEGVAPASMILMKVMHDIFHDFDDWMIVIHDNLLIMGKGYEDLFAKLKLVIQRCKEVNLYLKIQKSSFGHKVVDFFGYVCSGNAYCLSDKRKQEIISITFPLNTKDMQRFLGAVMYFKPFIFNYSAKTSLFYDTLQKGFNWKVDLGVYKNAFESFKGDILNAFTLYHPNHSLPWFLYVDASHYAVGGVLIQKTLDGVQQVIAFVSHKLSKAALNWSVYEKEAFGMWFCVKQLKQYLWGKYFILLTDHRNLLWIESSEVAKVIRIRLYLQNFHFKVLHVAGVDNIFADWLSRKDIPDEMLQLTDVINLVEHKARDAFSAVHNCRMGHNGVRRTWLLLNQYYPGHGIKIADVANFISSCTTCQKYRLGMDDSLPSPVRSLSNQHRFTCGYDLLYVTPGDKEGAQYLHVLKLMPSRMIGLYPSRDLTAESLALALFQFFVTYGVVDVLVTDPGSNIDSAVTKLLLSWFGVRLRLSLVNRHQSNGVERTHREVLRFLSMLVADERVASIWSKPHVIGLVQFILNSQISRETGQSPFTYMFGALDAEYMKLPNLDTSLETSNRFMQALEQELKQIREAAYDTVARMQAKRRVDNPNSYAQGDMILLNAKSMNMKKTKLSPNYLGPYTVEGVNKADVTIKHLVTGDTKVVHMENIKPYFPNELDDAYKAAMVDYDQYQLDYIVTWRGDPEIRSRMHFLAKFIDGDEVWLPYSKDLSDTLQFQHFCERWPPLIPLRFSWREWKKFSTQEDKKTIVILKPNTHCYVDLRSWGFDWFESCQLADWETKVYVIKCRVLSYENKSKSRILMRDEFFKQSFVWKNSDVIRYGGYDQLLDFMVLVDDKLADNYPVLKAAMKKR